MSTDLHTGERGASAAQLRLGRREVPAEPVQLVAGPVTALLYEGDLRHVRLGKVEIAQRIYVAVRDEAWNTIPGEIGDVEVQSRDGGFLVTFTSRHRHQDIDFAWRAEIRGMADGAISYRMLGQAATRFRYAKIGLNVHHPLRECAGRPYVAQTAEGERRGHLPTDIAPQLLDREGNLTGIFPPYDTLEIALQGGLDLRFRFVGELFELQDHRNWTDANFKSYCTPVSLPWPFDAEPGQRIEQAVELDFTGSRPPHRPPRAALALSVGEETLGALPPIGFGLPEQPRPLVEPDLALLGAAAPAHLRLDVAVGEQDSPSRLRAGLEQARAVGAQVELGLFVQEGRERAVAELLPVLEGAGGEVARVLLFAGGMGFSSTSGTTTPAALLRAVQAQLGGALPGVPFAGGTNQFFTELNRHRPQAAGMEGLVYSINPQVHAADDWSLMENVLAQADTVAMAAKLAPGLPLFVSPVTLIGRYGPFPAGPPQPGGLPANVDARQSALFCAAWTVGSIAQLAAAGVAALTYFEIVGESGIVPGGAGGQVFPVYHVFADLAELGGARLLPVEVEDREALAALALAGQEGEMLLIANLGPTRQRVSVPDAGRRFAEMRLLDTTNAQQARAQPQIYRETRQGLAGSTSFELEPYAVLRLSSQGAVKPK